MILFSFVIQIDFIINILRQSIKEYNQVMSIQKNIDSIKSDIQKLSSKPVKLVAVTKNRTIDQIHQAIEAGITDIGENRLQEAKEKLPHIPKNITKHFVGRLQTNKVCEVVRLFDVIQSVDSLKLAKKIDQECKKINKIMPVLIQVNTSDEPQKGGVAIDDAVRLIEEVSKLKNIQIQGLMTLAIYSADENKVRTCFKKLKQLFDQMKNVKCEIESEIRNQKCKMKYLSMGMSEDYQIAIKEGTNMVRIGRRIFGD